MAGYEFSSVDVWLMNAVEEGYHFDERCRVPVEWVEEVVVWEGLWYIVPACRVRITDFGMSYLSYRSMGNVVVGIGLDRSRMVVFDMAVCSVGDSKLEHVTRPAAVSLKLMGYGMPGVWLLAKGFKGYGEKSASRVAVEFVSDVVYSNYSRVCRVLRWEEDVDPSYDKKSYLQGGRSGFSFLGYLRDCARSRGGEQDYFVWFEPVEDGGGVGWRFRFKSFAELVRQDVKCYLEYVVEPRKWDEAWENYGYLREEGVRVVPFMWYEVLSKSIVSDTMKARFVRYGFDLVKLGVEKVVVDKVGRVLGKNVRSNVVASVLSKARDIVTEVVNVGAVDVRDRTVPDMGLVQKCRMMRKWCVVVPGVSELGVGDKVRVMFPDGYGEMCEALSGEWIVGGVVHLWSNPGRNYLKKLVLVSEAWKGEKKGFEDEGKVEEVGGWIG
jgi:hypothetical protein